MVLYQGMYNVAHFEINNDLQLYDDVLVGDEYDYKRLRKICFVSGSVYINKAIVNGSEIKGGAHVTIQDESIFVNIVPENESDGIVIGITFYLNDNGDMYAYTEKREGGPSGTVVESFNGRTGAVVPADSDYNAGMIGYDNTVSQLVAENAQDAIDELDQEIDNIQDEIEDLDAEHIAYDNSTSGLVSTNVQNAIDELDNDVSGKQDRLTFDTAPTASSTNPVTSDGVYHAIENVESLIPTEASEISYSNTVSGLTATDVQAAIDELAAAPAGVSSFNSRTGAVLPAAHDYDGDQVDYDNTTSGLVATDVQSAIDEVNGKIPDDAGDVSYDNTTSGLTATDVQAALDEIAHDVLTSGVASFNSRTGAVTPAAHDYDADQVDYDNTTSGLVATDVQSAIDELAGATGGVASFNGRTGVVTPAAHDYDGDQVDYDNTTSGLTATDVQAAIDEVNGKSGVTTFNSRSGAISPTANDYSASMISAGTFLGKTNANATAAAILTDSQMRDIEASTTDLTAGTSTLTAGKIYLVYET